MNSDVMEFRYLGYMCAFTVFGIKRTMIKTSERTAVDSTGKIWKFDVDSLVDVIEQNATEINEIKFKYIKEGK